MLFLNRMQQQRSKYSILPEHSVSNIVQNYGEPALLYCNNNWIPASCLRCEEQYCIKYKEEEISCPAFTNFSYERDLNVCPVEAIKWDYALERPCINNETCLKCGLCAARCPIGAIYIKDGKIVISEYSKVYKDIAASTINLKAHKRQIQELRAIVWQRHYQKESDLVFNEIYQIASCFVGSRLPNIFVRNLIIALNYDCAISRSGDVYTRMDAVYAGRRKYNNDTKGVVEIEFGKDTLDTSRGILEDIAVLHSRANIEKNKNTAVVVCLSLPNGRQNYLQVIKDINRILKLQIQTISLGALLLLVWNGVEIDFRKKEFYVDFDHRDIRTVMEHYLGRKIDISKGFCGILEPKKEKRSKSC